MVEFTDEELSLIQTLVLKAGRDLGAVEHMLSVAPGVQLVQSITTKIQQYARQKQQEQMAQAAVPVDDD